jgi:DNA-binding NtrC family response regulator
MKIHLLIIETNDQVRQNLVQRLSIDQYSIFTVDHPDKVKEIIKKKKVDVVLLGLVGLGEKGLSVLTTIKRIRPLTEIIIINDSAKISLSMQGMKLGAFEDFYMPFEINTLIQTIQAAYFQKAEYEREKKSPFRKYQGNMSAVASQKMGEENTAMNFFKKVDQSSSSQQRPRKIIGKEKQNGAD